MATITLQVLDGLEMGHVFDSLPTPISIGREEDNQIRLNDERVSRFHAKIQEDNGRVILTDLESTNGTRVNGHPVRMRVLQIGDQVLIGRCLLLYGSAEEIAQRASEVEEAVAHPFAETSSPDAEESVEEAEVELPGELFPDGPPAIPNDLSLRQSAELSDVVNYVHSRLLRVLLLAQQQGGTPKRLQAAWMTVPPAAWMSVSQLQADLAGYIRKLSDPGSM
jgi:pSer/pThr/pTyr-binding forkhead associated (FHA) protein